MALFIIALLLIGGIIGYKIGRWTSEKAEDALYTQNMLLQQYNTHWSEVSANRVNLTQQVTQSHVNAVSVTLQTVVQMLAQLQQQEAHKMDDRQREDIQRLINQAHTIASPQ